jgi:hypothetical protein
MSRHGLYCVVAFIEIVLQDLNILWKGIIGAQIFTADGVSGFAVSPWSAT